ncbi:hypothetical protein TSUD_407860 [Trifolium subterraneum]|uniref:Retrotransposon gag domain-containing protein n=1 Tax=Trifolium subterraneum TaxID=3900 RepID=A0A2Z6PR74_TRISU|nr:hypothetical protein TSUD_407860 [Trifolium subterraneum]
MPPKKVTVPAFKQMEARVEALESEISVVRTSLIDVQNTVKENHASLMAFIEKLMGKSIQEESSGGSVKSSPEKEKVLENLSLKGEAKWMSSNSNRNDTISEFRHAVRKVELPLFNGEDPAGWISRAEIYFRIQETTPEVKVRLAQICMEGSTIHFFNSLWSEDEGLTWEGLKEALLGRYGGHGDGDVYEQLTELRQKGTTNNFWDIFYMD